MLPITGGALLPGSHRQDRQKNDQGRNRDFHDERVDVGAYFFFGVKITQTA
jgi:hypothetical protein